MCDWSVAADSGAFSRPNAASREKRSALSGVTNHIPFGYNPDGSYNEREGEVIRFVFAKFNEYFFNLPQRLIDEAHTWAASEGFTLNDEEAQDMARSRLAACISLEVSESFPDVRFRKAAHGKGKHPIGLKYPSRSFNDTRCIDHDLLMQVREIISRA